MRVIALCDGQRVLPVNVVERRRAVHYPESVSLVAVGLCGEESCGVEGLWNLEDRCISLGISILSRGTRRSMKQRNKKEQEAEEQEGTGSRGTRGT